MRLYLSYKQMPEFKALSKDIAVKRYRTCYLISFLHWEQWVGLALIALSVIGWSWITKNGFPLLTMNKILEDFILVLCVFWGTLAYLLLINYSISKIYRSKYL